MASAVIRPSRLEDQTGLPSKEMVNVIQPIPGLYIDLFAFSWILRGPIRRPANLEGGPMVAV